MEARIFGRGLICLIHQLLKAAKDTPNFGQFGLGQSQHFWIISSF